MGAEHANYPLPEDDNITRLFENLDGVGDFIGRATASGKTAIEAAIRAQRTTSVYEAGPVQIGETGEKWAGQPNSAL